MTLVRQPTFAPPPKPSANENPREHDLELDCRAQQCPIPVLRLARTASSLSEGGLVLVRADDPAFPRDLRAWARSADARIMRLDEHEQGYEALIRIGGGAPPIPLPRAPRATPMVADPSPIPASPPSPTAPVPAEPLTEPTPATQTFDLRGHPREVLIGILTRACARLEPGVVFSAVVDDESFIGELRRWETEADATVLAIEHRESIIEARVRVDPASSKTESRALAKPAPMIQSDAERCTLLILHNDHEALLAALLIANGAAAQGMETSVFFTFWGLNLLRDQHPDLTQPKPKIGFMQRLMKWMMPKGPERQPLGQMNFGGLGKGMLSSIMRQQQIMTLPELMDNAQQLGVRFTACTMSMSVMGIDRRDLHPYPNLDYGGVASFVDDARSSVISMVF